MRTPPGPILERRTKLLEEVRSYWYGTTLATLWEWVWEDYGTDSTLDGKSAGYRSLTRDIAALEREGLIQRVRESEGRTWWWRYYDAARPVRRMEAA